mmetsp:Transcript_42071/g.30852  ORF Transcript_42071/g.30852 Transcript_42071/m.30852 type:complete len:163 (-) Transcript_42071:39-527(-)
MQKQRVLETESRRFYPESSVPFMHLQYVYKYPFLQVVQGSLLKHQWEFKTNLTTVTAVEHPDPDTLVFYRRYETIMYPKPTFERVVVNRREKTMTTYAIKPKFDGSETYTEFSVIKPKDEAATEQNFFLIDDSGAKTLKLERFKVNVEKCLKNIQFLQLQKE